MEVKEMYINVLKQQVLNELSDLVKSKEMIHLGFEALNHLDDAIDCQYLADRSEHLIHCVLVLLSDREENKNKIRQLKDENEALKKQVYEQKKVIETYNGTYSQRAKVKSGLKIAKKNHVTKEAIQELQEQGLGVEQIAKRLGCSRITIWRRLNKQSE